MKIQIIRDTALENVTFGQLFVNGELICQTLEDAFREEKGKPVKEWKIPGKTAIPSGKYSLILSESNRFKKILPEILKVEGFTGIRIHSGNTEHDTEGCPLVGLRRDGASITQSRDAMAKFMKAIEGAKSMTLEIINAFPES